MEFGSKLWASSAIALAGFALDIFTPLGLATWLIQLAAVWVTGRWADRPAVIMVAAVCSLFVLAGFSFSPQGATPIWIPAVNRICAVAAIWLLAGAVLGRKTANVARRTAESELAKASAEVRTLSSLLPICSACKRIRNENGSWEPFEVYLRNRSGVQITHGLCQDCIARLYPEYDLERKSK